LDTATTVALSVIGTRSKGGKHDERRFRGSNPVCDFRIIRAGFVLA
jgi:hypothetical protein